jgi:hypothetical protein
MRNTLCSNVYDYVFNLFTSFGYFDSDYENLRAIDTMATALNRGGMLVLDYLNAGLIANQKQITEDRTIDGLQFTIRRYIAEKHVVKDIVVSCADGVSHFSEQVELLQKDHFERYFSDVGLGIEACFGDYDLNPYNPATSSRLIFIARKK